MIGKNFLKNLFQRRVPQIMGIYFGTSWVVIEFANWLVNSFDLFPKLPQIVFVVLLTLIPSVGILAYFHGKPGRDKWTRIEKIAIPINLLIAVVVLTFIFYGKESPQETVPLDKYRIAVLPLANISSDPENEYFADGMTEELISNLSKIGELRVIARTSIMQYKGVAKSVSEIGRELKVGTVLEGSVRRAANNLRITVQLVDAQTQEHLWSQDYDRELKDVFEIQSDIAQRIAEAMKVELIGEQKQQIEKKTTENLEAYNLYLEGRYYWNKRTGEMIQKAIGYFNRAIEKDPNYALAYAGLADSYVLQNQYSNVPPGESFPKGRRAALMALKIDETLAEAHSALAYVKFMYDWDWSEAEIEFERALELNPNYATARQWYAEYLVTLGRHEEAIAEIKRAHELDPLSLIVNAVGGFVFLFARQYDQGIEQCRKTIEMDEKFYVAHFFLGWLYDQKGMHEEAITVAQQAVNLSGGFSEAIACLGYVFGKSGKRGEAIKLLDNLKEKSNREYVSSIDIATIYIGLGEKNQALDWLEKAYEDREILIVQLKEFPVYDSLRSDARFTELLRKIGLEN